MKVFIVEWVSHLENDVMKICKSYEAAQKFINDSKNNKDSEFHYSCKNNETRITEWEVTT